MRKAEGGSILQHSGSLEQVCWWRCFGMFQRGRAAHLQVIFLGDLRAGMDEKRCYMYTPTFLYQLPVLYLSGLCNWFFHLGNQKSRIQAVDINPKYFLVFLKKKKKKALLFEDDDSFSQKFYTLGGFFRDSQNHWKTFGSVIDSIIVFLVDLLGMSRTCSLILS